VTAPSRDWSLLALVSVMSRARCLMRFERRASAESVVISTRVPTGRIFPLSAAKGSALAVKRSGCVLADDLSPQKARILLMFALTKTHDPGALQKYFDN
jgi:L-asparaginase/Glu-tRNA(Gln) amidotransferase subunit D